MFFVKNSGQISRLFIQKTKNSWRKESLNLLFTIQNITIILLCSLIRDLTNLLFTLYSKTQRTKLLRISLNRLCLNSFISSNKMRRCSDLKRMLKVHLSLAEYLRLKMIILIIKWKKRIAII